MRGLRVQLALFYLILSVPALLIIEHASITFEFARCLRQLDDGRVQRLLDTQAQMLADAIRAGASDSEIELRLQKFVLQLERPRESLGTTAAYVLLELAERPFHAEVLAGEEVRWSAGPPLLFDSHSVRRHWSALITPASAAARQPMQLTLDLSVPSPWRRLGERLSFEWPIAFAFLLLFLVSSAWFLRRRVLVRIERMGEAARAWARGDFVEFIHDAGKDELATLAGDLDRMAADLKALVTARAQLATLEERRRLARDLHDTVKQKVFALSLQLAAAREGAADEQRAQQRLVEATALVEEIQSELADQLRELRDDAGPADDLVLALQRRLADFSRRSGCAVNQQLPASLRISPTEENAVLRVVDEALANIWRHAEASRVDVTLEVHDGSATVIISDNGRGGAHETPAGMGLANMRHRTERLPGGSLSVAAPESGGTCVRLSFRVSERVGSR